MLQIVSSEKSKSVKKTTQNPLSFRQSLSPNSARKPKKEESDVQLQNHLMDYDTNDLKVDTSTTTRTLPATTEKPVVTTDAQRSSDTSFNERDMHSTTPRIKAVSI